MASPIIDSITPPGPLNLNPGQTIEIVVVAHDPDARSGSCVITATDAEGNGTPITVTVNIADPVTITASCDVGTVTPEAGVPGHFSLTV